MIIKKWPSPRCFEERSPLQNSKNYFLGILRSVTRNDEIKTTKLDMIIRKWPSPRCFEERSRFQNSRNYFLRILGSVTRIDEIKTTILQGQGVQGEKMGISSKTARSPFFRCHFRSRNKINFFLKIFIFGGLPIRKPYLDP